MVTVASLLNPLPPPFERYREPHSPIDIKRTLPSSLSLPPAKKQKMSKAAATFVKGKPKGEIRYKPFEVQDDRTAAEHEKYKVQPIGRIGEYPKRIPYNSEKKSFQQKTGRDGFEVYQYSFRMPEDSHDKDAHTVMWDYNVGLVRMTSFFKSLKHTKTMPAKMMSANPGLREISHSITGGSISAQGYWVPFEAAKAVAAKFCYEIRYVLAPVFGPDFVSMCPKPNEISSFMRLDIDRNIILRCTEAANGIHTQPSESSLAVSPRTPVRFTPLPAWPMKSLRPKPIKPMDVESGYGTDTDRSEKHPGSPESNGAIEWTPVNTPRSTNLERFRFPPQSDVTSNPRDRVIPAISNKKKRSPAKRPLPDKDEASYGNSSDHTSVDAPASPKQRKISAELTPEAQAAHTLMQLFRADATLGEKRGLKRRCASA